MFRAIVHRARLKDPHAVLERLAADLRTGFFEKATGQPHAKLAASHRPVLAMPIDGERYRSVAIMPEIAKLCQPDQHVTLRRPPAAVACRSGGVNGLCRAYQLDGAIVLPSAGFC